MDSIARVRRLTARRTRVNEEWREAIRQAHAEGHSLRAIATAAGVTNPRVHQIVHAARSRNPRL